MGSVSIRFGLLAVVCVLVMIPVGPAAACDDIVIASRLIGIGPGGEFAIEKRSSGGAAASNHEIAFYGADGTLRGRVVTCKGAECADAANGKWQVEGPETELASALTAGATMPTPRKVKKRLIARLGLAPARRARARASAHIEDDRVAFHVGKPDGTQVEVGDHSLLYYGGGPPAISVRLLERGRSPLLFVAFSYRSSGGGCSSRIDEVMWFARSQL